MFTNAAVGNGSDPDDHFRTAKAMVQIVEIYSLEDSLELNNLKILHVQIFEYHRERRHVAVAKDAGKMIFE